MVINGSQPAVQPEGGISIAASAPDPGSSPEQAPIRGFRPIKVCFISPLGYGLYNPASQSPFGGAEVQFFLLAHELAQDPAFEVAVLTTVPDSPGTEPQGRLTLVKRQGQGRRSVGANAAGRDRLRAWRGYGAAFGEMWSLFRELDADVYLHAGAGVEVGAYALIGRLLRRRFVYVLVSSADLSDPYGKVEGPLKRLFPLGMRLADAVVCQTQEHLAALKARYHREGVLIRTGHPLPSRPPAAGAQDGKSTILWAGRAHPLKQPGMFLDLIARLPQERGVMVIMRDDCHPTLLEDVRAQAAGLRNLTLHEDVPWRDIGRFFEEAKLFVNTSTYEGFPNTFVQAAMQATPILSWTVDPDGVLARHRIGLCAGGSFEKLVALAGQLCAAEATRDAWGRRALAYAREHHDLHRSAAALKALMKSLAPQARGGRSAKPSIRMEGIE